MIWKDLASIYGVMVEGMKGSIIMIKKVDMEYITGLMEENMKVGGLKGSNMDLECIQIQ